MNFNGLDEESVLLNGVLPPLTAAIGDGMCTCDGALGHALRLTFAPDAVLALIPSSTNTYTFTVTGVAEAGPFSASDIMRIAPYSEGSPPCERFSEVFGKHAEQIRKRAEKSEAHMEKKRAQLESRQEKLHAKFEKRQEKLKERLEKWKKKFDD